MANGPKSHREVIAGVDLLSERALRSVAKDYNRDVVSPFLRAIADTKSFEGLRKRLSVSTLKSMRTDRVADCLASAGVQAALAAETAAKPRL